MKITEAVFVLFDTETGGLKKDEHDLLEIGAQAYGVDDGIPVQPSPDDRFTALVAPTRPIPVESQAIHHLRARDFEGAPTREDALHAFRTWLPPHAVLVAHNAPFDVGFMGLEDYPLVLDSRRMAGHLTPEAPSLSLQVLRYFYGFEDIDQEGLNPHRAIADVLVLAPVFFHLLALYRAWAASVCGDDQERLDNALQVETVMKWAARPHPILRWNKGPDNAYGKLFTELDLGLLTWALSKDMGPDIRWNVEREIARRKKANAPATQDPFDL